MQEQQSFSQSPSTPSQQSPVPLPLPISRQDLEAGSMELLSDPMTCDDALSAFDGFPQSPLPGFLPELDTQMFTQQSSPESSVSLTSPEMYTSAPSSAECTPPEMRQPFPTTTPYEFNPAQPGTQQQVVYVLQTPEVLHTSM